MKKLQMAAVVIGLLLILLFLLPEFAQLVGIALAIVFKLLIIALIILVVWFAGWMFWDVPGFFYRRYFAAYVRLRRMRRNRHLREWREAAARSGDH